MTEIVDSLGNFRHCSNMNLGQENLNFVNVLFELYTHRSVIFMTFSD